MHNFNWPAILLALTACSAVPGCIERSPQLLVQPLDNPSETGARLPRLAATGEGVLLSWVEPVPDRGEPTYRLRFAEYSDQNWSPSATITSGSNWFINWADFPSVYRGSTGNLAAHWLQRSSGGTYSYDVKTTLSSDGTNWSEAYAPHLDNTMTEHGFASFFELGDAPAIVWLDGRNTQAADHEAISSSHGNDSHGDGSGEGIGGAMTLRMRSLTVASAGDPAVVLDNRVCDCCQTAAVNADNGPVVFYRDRSAQEIRDISYVYFQREAWSKPAVVHPDGWEIAGCPVNGPQADTLDGHVAVAWFTGADDKPAVKLAFTTQINTGFDTPIIVSERAPLGRVDITMLADHTAMVAWLEDVGDGKVVIKTGVFNKHGSAAEALTIDTISAQRASGFLQLARVAPTTAVLAYSDVDSDRIRSVSISVGDGL